MLAKIEKALKPSTLKKRLYIFFAILAIPSLLAVISYQYLITINDTLKAREESFSNIAGNAVISFNAWKDMNRKRLNILALEIEEHAKPNPRERKKLTNALKLFTSIYTDAYIAHVLNTKGFQMARSDFEKPLADYSDREYFKDAYQNKYGEQTVISKTYSKPALCNAIPIHKNNIVNAVLSTCVFLKDLRNQITHEHIGKTGSYLLINNKNQLISENTQELANIGHDPAVRALRNGKTGSNYYTENGIKWITHIQPLADGWGLILKQEYSEVVAASNDHLQKALILIFILFSIASAIVLHTFSYFLKPIFDLTNSIEKQKAAPEKIKLSRPDEEELAFLTDAFNSVAESLQRSIQNINGKNELLLDYKNKLEFKINEQNKILKKQEKTANLGIVAGNIAHEIKNPISIISGKSGQIKTWIETNNPQKESKILEAVNKIEGTIERIVKIIRGIQSIARNAEQDPMEQTHLPALIGDIQEIYKPHFASKNIKFQIGNIPDIYIYCRGIQISQTIVNLLNNAADAVSSLPQKWVHLDFATTEHVIRITITDSGNGIPSDIANNLMQDYFTTKEAHKGTGLGLSISKQLINAHGGNFYLNRAHPHTQFVIELPIKNSSKIQLVA